MIDHVEPTTGEIIETASDYGREQGRLSQRDVEAYWARVRSIIDPMTDQDLSELLASALSLVPEELRAMVAKKNPRTSKLAKGYIMQYLGQEKR